MSVTTSTRSLCTFWLAGHCYGVDVLDVQEVLLVHELTRVPRAHGVVEGLMNLRGLILTAIDLRRRMQLPERDRTTTAASIVVRADDGPVSLLVDRIGDVVEVGPETFEPAPDATTGSAREFVIGAYKLDGVLLLELDTKRVIADPTASAV